MSSKVDRLLAVLRGEVPAEEPPPQEEAPQEAAPAQSAEAEVAPLREKIAELEQKLADMSAPPPLESLPQEPAVEPAPAPQPEAPQAPSELTVFLHTRLELLEKRLELAQQEALRANLLLREREDAQRKAQKEVEDLFRSIREQQRAATWDRALRDKASSAQARLKDLEVRLQLAQMRMIPAEEVLRCIRSEEGRAELEARLRRQLEEAGPAAAEPVPAQAPEPPAVPAPPALPAPSPGPALDPGRVYSLDPPPGLETLAAAMGRIADLERKIQESEDAREKERQERLRWESEMLESLRMSRRSIQKAGGPELLVEAALESMVDCLRERDAAQAEVGAALEALQAEPPGSEALGALKERLAEARGRMEAAQRKLDQQTAIVQAWVERNKGTGERFPEDPNKG